MDTRRFLISRHGKTHGPCNLAELKAYVAYGSLHLDELVSISGTNDWRPCRQFVLAPEEEKGESWLTRLWRRITRKEP